MVFLLRETPIIERIGGLLQRFFASGALRVRVETSGLPRFF
jgi:hypothetical protein